MIAELALKLLRLAAKKLIAAATNTDQPDDGQWRGKYALTPVEKVNGTQVYLFETDKADPLRLFTHGIEYKVYDSFYTDLGSVPKLAQKIPRLHLKPDDFQRSYLLHDATYYKAKFWIRKPEATSLLTEVAATRKDADLLLFIGLSCDARGDGTKPSWADCHAIFEAVRLGAGLPWRRHRAREAK